MGRFVPRVNHPRSIGVALLTFSSFSHAQMEAVVELSFADCASDVVEVQSVVELLRVELREHGIDRVVLVEGSDSRSRAATPRLTVSASCEEPTSIHVRLDRGQGTRTTGLTVDLADMAEETRPRTLALTAGALWEKPTESTTKALPPPPAPVKPPEPVVIRVVENRRLSPARPRDPEMWLAFALGARTTENGGTLGGAWLLGSQALSSSFRLRLEAGAQEGERTTSLGDIHVWGVAGSVGVSGASRGAVLALELGPLLEVGYGWMKGEPARTDVRGDEGGGPMVNIVLDTLVRARFEGMWLGTGVQTGYVLHGLEPTVEGAPMYGTRGAILGARVMVGWDAW